MENGRLAFVEDLHLFTLLSSHQDQDESDLSSRTEQHVHEDMELSFPLKENFAKRNKGDRLGNRHSKNTATVTTLEQEMLSSINKLRSHNMLMLFPFIYHSFTQPASSDLSSQLPLHDDRIPKSSL